MCSECLKKEEEEKNAKKKEYHLIAQYFMQYFIFGKRTIYKKIYNKKIQRFCEFDNNFVGNQTVKLLCYINSYQNKFKKKKCI